MIYMVIYINIYIIYIIHNTYMYLYIYIYRRARLKSKLKHF